MNKNNTSKLIPVVLLASFSASPVVLPAMAEGLTGSVAGQEAQKVAANKEISRRFLMTIPAKDADTMRSILAPTAHLSLKLAGIYSPELHAFPEGTQWNRDETVNMEIGFQKELKGPFTLKILSIIGEGDLVAVEAIGQGVRASTNRPYLQHYSYHFQLENGKIVEARLYEDTFHYWDVWNNPGPPAQRPKSLVPVAQSTVGPNNAPTAESATPKVSADQVALNKEAVRRFATAVPTRDPDTERAVWAPDSVWCFAVAGDYSPELHAFQGAPRWTREPMIKMQQDFQNNLIEPETLEIYSMIGEGNDVSVELVGFNIRSDGRAYRQRYSYHIKLRDGKLLEGHVYQDTLHQYDLGLDHAKYAPVAAPIAR